MSQLTELENALRRFSRLIERIAKVTGADPRTIVKHFSGGPARGVVGHRIARALSATESLPGIEDEQASRGIGGAPDAGTLRRLAADAEVDPRTLLKVLRNEPVRGGAAQRALDVLVEAGLIATSTHGPHQEPSGIPLGLGSD